MRRFTLSLSLSQKRALWKTFVRHGAQVYALVNDRGSRSLFNERANSSRSVRTLQFTAIIFCSDTLIVRELTFLS